MERGKGFESFAAEVPWKAHPVFEGVELKLVLPLERTEGLVSFHLVRIAPGKKIGLHIHEKQMETHEILEGRGICVCDGTEILYEPGVVSVLSASVPHEVKAGAEGLKLFAKFFCSAP